MRLILAPTIGTTIGNFNIVIAPASYTMYKSTANGVATYFAKNRHGHLRSYASDTATVSGLKAVLDALKGTGVSFFFATTGSNPTTYSFLDDVAGQLTRPSIHYMESLSGLNRLKQSSSDRCRMQRVDQTMNLYH